MTIEASIGLAIAFSTLLVLAAQLLTFRRQARIMEAQAKTADGQTQLMRDQAAVLKSQLEIAELQAEWRRHEALGTFYRIAFDLVAEFKKANVMTMTRIPANYDTHPRQMLREAGRLFAPLGHDVVRAATQAAIALDDYFRAVEEYNARHTGIEGAGNWTTVQNWRKQVGRDLDLVNSLVPKDIRWTYSGGPEYNFLSICSLAPDIAAALGQESDAS